jgi:prevent-host-death family protein
MDRMSVTEAREFLADIVNRVAYGGERIVMERHGKGIAALVSVEDLALLEEIEDRDDVKAARRALREEGSEAWEVVKKRNGLA